MQKATFIIHSKLVNKKHLQRKIKSTFEKDLDLTFSYTEEKTGAKNITIKEIKNKPDFIIICGGDGSINEMVNAFCQTNTTENILFGILPLGTGNDFVKSLNIKKGINNLKELILKKNYTEVDIYNMNFVNLKNENENRFFINISDIGIGGYVAQTISKSNKCLGSNITYFIAIIKSFLKYRKQKIKIESKSFNWQGNILSLCMANGKYFGSGLCIAPDAKVNDEKLQLTILGNVSIFDYIKNIGNLKRAKKIDHPEVQYISVENCKITSLDTDECPIDMDGEFIGFTPIEVHLHSKKIKILN